MAASFIGWHRARRRGGKWLRAVEATAEAACMALLLAAPPPEPGRLREFAVLPAGEHPDDAVRARRGAGRDVRGLRSARRKTHLRRGAPPLTVD